MIPPKEAAAMGIRNPGFVKKLDSLLKAHDQEGERRKDLIEKSQGRRQEKV
jgi:hypothetical protein